MSKLKEYLTSDYQLVTTDSPAHNWIEVPEGAVALTGASSIKLWWNGVRNCAANVGFSFREATHSSYLEYLEDVSGSLVLWQRDLSTTFTKPTGRFLHQEWYERFGRGEDVQFNSHTQDKYHDINIHEYSFGLFNIPTHTFRSKPKTITIGSRTINAPISEKPEVGVDVFATSLSESKFFPLVWTDYSSDFWYLKNNLLHLNKEGAIAHAEALLALMSGEAL